MNCARLKPMPLINQLTEGLVKGSIKGMINGLSKELTNQLINYCLTDTNCARPTTMPKPKPSPGLPKVNHKINQ